ncbi:MAG: transposase [Flavobacteriales bacterium]|nr:MAG: transposase [Flavobacteriales bacterium]
MNKLRTIPGCGITTVAAIVAETNGFKEFKSASSSPAMLATTSYTMNRAHQC